MNKKIPRVKTAKYQIQTVGAALLLLKLFKEISLSWITVLSPFLFLLAAELLFLLIGIITYYTNRR